MSISIFLYFSLGLVSGFDVFWNAPTFQCSRNYAMNFVSLLKTYGIRANSGDEFHGDQVTIFYHAQLGLYPRINEKSGVYENGGIPQKGDFPKHFKKASEDIDSIIPSKDFDGLGVIDWEAWRPTWEFNWDAMTIYRQKSLELAKELNPTANSSFINQEAERSWENSAKKYMLETLRLAKKSRPKAPWGFYLFPDCYNYQGEKPKDFQCSEKIRKGNDKLSWLWKESTALFPSIYVHSSHTDKYTFEQRTWKDNEKLREALRVASKKAKIYPYVNYFASELLPKEDVWRMLAQAAATGSHGAVIWGASASLNNAKMCRDLKEYIVDTLGPAAEKVAWRSNLCSKEVCNGHGKCTFPDDEYARAWKLFIDDSKNFYAGDITCRCDENYSGRFCNKKVKRAPRNHKFNKH